MSETGKLIKPELKDLESAREFFSGDRYATEATGVVIEEVSRGYARVSLTLGPRHRNAAGLVMGAVYYTMGDFAFAVAANFDGPLTVTRDASIRFLKPAAGDRLIAEAREKFREGRCCTYEIKVKDNLDNQVALITTTGVSQP